MIRVSKPATAPRILRDHDSSGPKATRALEQAYDAGEREFKFNSDIYGAKSVKNALIKAQFDKCCFCESKITHVYYGDVEHFRPKGGFRQQSSDPLVQPGYYWLAYAWTNLFLSCALCNQRYKGNLFPLANPPERARSHHDNIQDEDPLFIHPVDNDPEEYIGFRDEYAYAIDGNNRGEKTIQALGLDRDELDEMRRDVLTNVRMLQRTLRLYDAREDGDGSPLSEDERTHMLDISDHLARLVEPDVQYSAMLRCALNS